MELQALTGQLYVNNGEVQGGGQPPGLLAQPAPAGADRSRQRDYLFVHLTLSGPPEETESLLQDLVDAVSASFYKSSGSVTSALRKAILEANRLLFEFNMSSGGAAREGALTCAARRGQDLFMVQSGEALAMIGRPFGVERLPTTKPERVTPLGRTAGVDIRFFHNVLQPGDMLLLADPRLGHLTAQALEPALVDNDVEHGLEALVRIVGPGTARLLLVEFTDDPLDDIPDSGAAAALNLPRIERPTLRTPNVNVNVERTARRGAAQTARGLSRASDGLADVLTQIRPPQEEEAAEPRSWLAPLVLAILIPVVIGAIVAGVYLQRDVVRQTAALELSMSENLSAGEVAEREERVEDARASYAEVLRLAGEAEENLGTLSDFMNGMRQEAQLALDRLDNISRLTTQALYTFEEESVRLSRLTLRQGFDGDFFTLDRANNRVWFFDTDETYMNLVAEEPRRVFSGGDAVGGHIVGPMVDLIWRPAGRIVSEPRLAILDTSGAILTWDAAESTGGYVSVDLASEWLQPLSLTTYNERLYVLDQGNGVLWRYFPDNNRYVLQEGSRVLTFREDAGLDQAVDFDINNEDAKVVVVYASGDIRYYDSNSGLLLWSSADLANRGLSTPLVAPVSAKIVGRGVSSSIFVADAATGRIIQLSQSGEVLAQYKATDEEGGELFSAVSDFAVQLNPLRILLPAGNVIYLATQ